jgi:hypothetical protein
LLFLERLVTISNEKTIGKKVGGLLYIECGAGLEKHGGFCIMNSG